jgi:HlyD family secretion protein
MEPTNKPSLARRLGWSKSKKAQDAQAIEFLPDADELERSPLPPIARVTLHVLAAALTCFAVWASVSKVDKVVVAHGRLVNPLPNIVLQPLETSIIQKISVKVGQVVKKGDVLATLDPTFSLADEAQLRGHQHSLETQAAGIRAELESTAPPPSEVVPPLIDARAPVAPDVKPPVQAADIRLPTAAESKAALAAAAAIDGKALALVASKPVMPQTASAAAKSKAATASDVKPAKLTPVVSTKIVGVIDSKLPDSKAPDSKLLDTQPPVAAAKPVADNDSRIQSSLANERQGNYRAQKTKLEENLARVRATLQTNQRDQLVLGARLRSSREIETMQEKLVAQQFGARIQLLEAADKRLEIERDMLLTRNKEVEIRSEMASLEAEIDAFAKGWRQKLTEDLLATTRELDSVSEQLQKADLRHKLVTMLAPVDAVVLDIAKLSNGSVIKEAEPFFTLVSLGAELEAEVQIDSVDVGYIKTGDPVHLKLDAFPFQMHGSLPAKVRSISEDAFRRDVAAGTGLDAYYVSRIDFGKARLKQMNDRNRLLPGMTLSAEIVVGRRSVMSYLVWPLTKALDEAISEP